MTTEQHPLLICLPYLPGEETHAERTLADALDRGTERCPVLLLRLGSARAINLEKSRTAVGETYVRAAAEDPRGPLVAAIAGTRREYAGYDLLLIRPGVDVPPGWDSRLRWAAYAEPGVGSVGPLCGSLGAIAAPPPLWGTAAADRLAYALGHHAHFQVNKITPGCVYLRANALGAAAADIARLDGNAAACLDRLATILYRHGFCNIAADHLWVYDPCPATADDAAEEPRARAMAALREAARKPSARSMVLAPIAGVQDKPVQLHVAHNWGGGLSHWVENYCRADRGRVNLVLKPIGTPQCYARGLALFEHGDDREPVHGWNLDPPIPTLAITHLQYRRVLQEIIDAYGVSAILVSSLIGHSLDVLASDVPTALVCHDYFPFCPAISITYRDKRGGPNTVCTSCDGSRLAECFAKNQYNRLILDATAEDWLSVRRRYLELVLKRSIPMIVPTPSVQRNLVALEPRLAGATFHVAAHGMQPFAPSPAASSSETHLALARDTLPSKLREPAERPRVVVLGRLTPEKGLPLILDAYAKLAGVCHLVLLGCSDGGRQLAGKRGVSVIPDYDREQLPALMAEIRPQIGLLPSVCAETFSYTLSELMSLGIPPLATRLGCFVDRIEEGVSGFLVEPTAEDLVRKVRTLLAEPSSLAEVRRALAVMAPRSLTEMVAQYHRILPVSTFSAQRYARGRTQQPAGCGVGQWKSHLGVVDETFEQLMDRTYRTIRFKLARTPRLRGWQRRLAGAVLAAGYRVLKLGWGRTARPARKTARPPASTPAILQGTHDELVLEEKRAA